MKHIYFFCILCLMTISVGVKAQLRIGITGGATYNLYTIENHYMNDWHYEGAWGGTAGIMTQYNLNDWFGIRADLNWTMKNHRQYRTGLLSKTDYRTVNHYYQLPVVASFSFGGERIKGFLNVGGYGGYWKSCWLKGTIASNTSYPEAFRGSYVTLDYARCDFVEERDNRFDCGFVGGVGIDWLFSKHWGVQFETRCYYSTISTQKDYMRICDPKYNTTFAFQFATYYLF